MAAVFMKETKKLDLQLFAVTFSCIVILGNVVKHLEIKELKNCPLVVFLVEFVSNSTWCLFYQLQLCGLSAVGRGGFRLRAAEVV